MSLMPTIHCHTARRRQASLTGFFAPPLRALVAAVAAALALAACGDPKVVETTPGVAAMPQSAEAPEAGRADPAYFPSQFPAPDGDIEPLPEQA